MTDTTQPPQPHHAPIAGVIGWPIAHSRSPRLHGHWLKRYGINGHYLPLPVMPEHLAEVLRAMPRMGFVGANVTLPHKESVLVLADVVTDRAALIGAANTLIFRPDGKIHADNTDGYGFIANIRQNAPGWIPDLGPAAVIGAGGAARAVSYAQHGSVGAGDGGPRWGMWGEVCGFAMIGRGGAMCRVTPFGLTRPCIVLMCGTGRFQVFVRGRDCIPGGHLRLSGGMPYPPLGHAPAR